MRAKRTPTPETMRVLSEILVSEFNNSQAACVKATGINPGAFYRVMSGERPATADLIGRVLKHLSKGAALKLVTAYLSDVATTVGAGGYKVRLSPIRPE